MEPTNGRELNFWSFVALARQRLAQHGVVDLPATELLLSLNRASAVVTYDLEATAHRPRGRSWAGFRLMYVLWLAGPLESKKLAELTGMSRAAVSNLTGPLVDAGLLRRQAHATDGRAVVLSLSEAGEDEAREGYLVQHEREIEWTNTLSEAEQRQLTDLLTRLMAPRSGFTTHERP